MKILDADELNVYKKLKFKSWYDTSNIVAIGYSRNKASSILKRLTAKGVLSTGKGKRGRIIYQVNIPYPDDPRTLGSLSGTFTLEELSDLKAHFIQPEIDAIDIIRRIELYWDSKVENITLVYYPKYICGLRTEDGSERTDIIDGVNGILNEI